MPMTVKEERIKKVSPRSGGLVATCEICGKRGASTHVPYKVWYWPVEGSGAGGRIAYRCKAHKP